MENVATYTRPEAARELGISVSSLIRLERIDPTFPSIRITPRRIIIPRDALHAWMTARATKRA